MKEVTTEILLGEKQLTKDQAIDIYYSKWWNTAPEWQVALIQLRQQESVMPFGIFLNCVNNVLKERLIPESLTNDRVLELAADIEELYRDEIRELKEKEQN